MFSSCFHPPSLSPVPPRPTRALKTKNKKQGQSSTSFVGRLPTQKKRKNEKKIIIISNTLKTRIPPITQRIQKYTKQKLNPRRLTMRLVMQRFSISPTSPESTNLNNKSKLQKKKKNAFQGHSNVVTFFYYLFTLFPFSLFLTLPLLSLSYFVSSFLCLSHRSSSFIFPTSLILLPLP